MNRTYELMFIVRPDMTDEDLDKLISTLQVGGAAFGRKCEERRQDGQAPLGLYRAPLSRRHLRADGRWRAEAR